MITKQEFISALQRQELLAARWARIIGLFMVGSVLGLAATDYAKTHGHLAWLGATNLAEVFGGVWLVVAVGLMAVFLAQQWRRRVLCPHCKKQLVQFSARIAVATGICSYCGEKIFEQSFKQA